MSKSMSKEPPCWTYSDRVLVFFHFSSMIICISPRNKIQASFPVCLPNYKNRPFRWLQCCMLKRWLQNHEDTKPLKTSQRLNTVTTFFYYYYYYYREKEKVITKKSWHLFIGGEPSWREGPDLCFRPKKLFFIFFVKAEVLGGDKADLIK